MDADGHRYEEWQLSRVIMADSLFILSDPCVSVFIRGSNSVFLSIRRRDLRHVAT